MQGVCTTPKVGQNQRYDDATLPATLPIGWVASRGGVGEMGQARGVGGGVGCSSTNADEVSSQPSPSSFGGRESAGSWDGAKVLNSQEVRRLRGRFPQCCDCSSKMGTDWVSISLGSFLCSTCAGIHRSLGTTVSKVRSLKLDRWSFALFTFLATIRTSGGANKVWEATADLTRKPRADDGRIVKHEWITEKYVLRKYIAGETAETSGQHPANVDCLLKLQDAVSRASEPRSRAQALLTFVGRNPDSSKRAVAELEKLASAGATCIRPGKELILSSAAVAFLMQCR